jgi:hypothetical protein
MCAVALVIVVSFETRENDVKDASEKGPLFIMRKDTWCYRYFFGS